MSPSFSLSYYIERAMAHATYKLLEDETFSGRISPCPGCIAFGKTLVECRDELQSTLEDWLLVGLRLGHKLPVIDGVDLNPPVKPKLREAV